MPKILKPKILDRDAAVLRQVAKPVPLDKITSKPIKEVISQMKKAMHSQDDSVAIAAPQIGESLRIFVVNGQAIAHIKEAETNEGASSKPADLVFINPEIIKLSKTMKEMEEGCLSVRWLYGKVKRSDRATVKAYDEKGRTFEIGGAGIMAQVFQHEIDHLDGILFTDKAEDIVDLPPDEQLKL